MQDEAVNLRKNKIVWSITGLFKVVAKVVFNC